MSFEKKFMKSRAVCKARFTVPGEAADGATGVFLVGDFNDWNHSSHPMKCRKDGSFSVEMELPSGRDYQFRYLTDTGRWFNDDAADAYVHCGFSGGENSLIKV